MKKIFAIGLALLILTRGVSAGQAYSEEIGLKIDPVWLAVQETFKPIGIAKANESKKVLTTKWIYDQVVRRGKYFKEIISQKYDRRYRMKITLIENYLFTKIEVKGVYQERSLGVSPETPWRQVKPKAADLEVERAYFFKILSQLEKLKKENRI